MYPIDEETLELMSRTCRWCGETIVPYTPGSDLWLVQNAEFPSICEKSPTGMRNGYFFPHEPCDEETLDHADSLQNARPHLPTDAKERKAIPLWSGLVQYFPDALVAVAKLSQAANDQHNPGEKLHWSRHKSPDHHDTLLRHLFDSGTTDTDGHPHSAKVAWRALAILQLELEAARESDGKQLD